MISVRFRVVLAIAVLIYYIILVRLIRKRRIILKYAILWMLLGGAFLLLVIFPGLLLEFANLVGIYGDVNFLFMVLIGLLIIVTMSLTMIVSHLNESNKKLAQQIALLGTELEELQKWRDECQRELR